MEATGAFDKVTRTSRTGSALYLSPTPANLAMYGDSGHDRSAMATPGFLAFFGCLLMGNFYPVSLHCMAGYGWRFWSLGVQLTIALLSCFMVGVWWWWKIDLATETEWRVHRGLSGYALCC